MALSRERPVVFVLRALGLGDLLTAVPALRALRSTFPKGQLVLGTPSQYEPLVRHVGGVDRVSPMRGLADLPADETRPDVAVNLHGSGPQSHRLLQSLEPGRLVAFASPGTGHRGPRWRPDEHEVSRWCRLVAETLRVPVNAADLQLAPPATRTPLTRAVVIHPGAAHPARRWPVQRFAEVAAWAHDNGLEVVVTGSSAERGLASGVASAAGLAGGSVLAGRLSLVELAALVSSAVVVVSGDTGVAHLATAYRTPSVILFGPTPPDLWGPPAGGPHVALWHGSRRGDPCGETVDPALLTISSQEVIDALDDLLSLTASRPTA